MSFANGSKCVRLGFRLREISRRRNEGQALYLFPEGARRFWSRSPLEIGGFLFVWVKCGLNVWGLRGCLCRGGLGFRVSVCGLIAPKVTWWGVGVIPLVVRAEETF